VMQPMGTLQPGLPPHISIPLDYCLCILDHKNVFLFFSTIPLHSKAEKNLLSLYHHQIIRPWMLVSIDSAAPSHG
jgi:hypothetical protein